MGALVVPAPQTAAVSSSDSSGFLLSQHELHGIRFLKSDLCGELEASSCRRKNAEEPEC